MSVTPQFCVLDKLSMKDCQYCLQWVTGKSGEDGCSTKVKWLLAHCHDGVTWGQLGDDHSWLVSSAFFPQVSPAISESNLLELRLFCEKCEILIWRTDKGFSGRCLTDNGEPDKNDPCRPDTETRILLGDRMLPDSNQKRQNPASGFTCVATARGLQQAVPVVCTKEDFSEGRWPLRLGLKNYFEQDEETGVVRVAASRLVNVKKV